MLGADIDNGAHLLLSGNDAALDYLQRIGSLGRMAGSDRAEFDFADLGTGQRWRLRPNEGRAPWWILDPKRRAPGTSLREHLALLAIFWPSAGGTVGDAMHCGGPLYDRLWRPLLLAALNTEPTISSARLASALVRGTLGRGGKACRPLVAVEGLSPTFVDPAIRFLAARGGKINLDHRLRRLVFKAIGQSGSNSRANPSRSGPMTPSLSLCLPGPPATSSPESRRPTNSTASSTRISAFLRRKASRRFWA